MRGQDKLQRTVAKLSTLLLFACGSSLMEQPHHLRFLALGDSYTIGEAVEPAERWPVVLAAQLRAENIDACDPEIIARTGWTTDELSAAIDDASPRGEAALVSLLIGVNNQYRGRAVDDYRVEFEQLLHRAIGFAGGDANRVMVLSIPDWGVTPFALQQGRDPERIASELDAYNNVAAESTRSAGAHWIDITPISRDAARHSALIAADGLHPSAEMYRRWVAAIEPVARQILSASKRSAGAPRH